MPDLHLADLQQHGAALLLLLLLLIVLAELLWLRRSRRAVYDWRETAASTAIAIGNRLIRPLTAALLAPLFLFAYAHRCFELALDGAAGFALVFVCVDFVYYFFHRANHRVAWLWATHSVHHSTTRFNFSAAYRLGWTDLLSGAWLFPLALVWLGLPPHMVLGAFALNLLYQFFLHTETVGRLGVLERILNTPTHHRVHHAHNAAVLDRNFGGVLIVWDRLFGTFAHAPVGEPLQYGLSGTARGHHPLRIVFGGWAELWAQARAAPHWRARLKCCFAPP